MTRIRLLYIVVKDGSKSLVSCLKFEPKVSNFPSTSSQLRLLVRLLLREVFSILIGSFMRVRNELDFPI